MRTRGEGGRKVTPGAIWPPGPDDGRIALLWGLPYPLWGCGSGLVEAGGLGIQGPFALLLLE